MKREITIVAEKVYDGTPGEHYEVGIEFTDHRGNHHTEKGWAGSTPEQGALRFLSQKAEGLMNLAESLADDAAHVMALVQYFSDHCEIDLINLPKVEYNEASYFGASRFDQMNRELSDLRKQVDKLHRCEHHRRFNEQCVYCPDGTSVGGPLDAGQQVEVIG